MRSSVEVLWTARYDYPAKWRLAHHNHDYFQFLYILSGRGSIIVDAEERALTPHLAVLVKPRQDHALTASTLVKTLDVKFRVISPRLRELLLAAPAFAEDGLSEVVGHLDRIRSEGEERLPFFRDLCAAHMSQILILFLRRHEHSIPCCLSAEDHPRRAADPITRKVLDMINKEYAAELNVQAIAHRLGLSERYVRGRFRAFVGMPPSDYLVHFRIERARELIEFSDYALKEIAALTGFKSIHHFTRTFVRIMHAPPGQWRRTYRDGIRRDVYISPAFSNTIWTQPASRTVPNPSKAAPAKAKKSVTQTA